MSEKQDVLLELIRDAENARAHVAEKVSETRARLNTLHIESARADAELSALVSAYERRYPQGSRALTEAIRTELSEAPEDWTSMSRTDAVEKAIQTLTTNQPDASPSDVERQLQLRGRSDDRAEIGGAISHLNRVKRIHRVGRGRWVIGPSPEASGDPITASSAQDELQAEEGGEALGITPE